MRFTPKYSVSYHGVIHKANVPFDIDEADAEELKKHGTVDAAERIVESETEEHVEEKPVKKSGRPKKTAE